MPEEHARTPATLALNTKLEDDFISPLTVVRGALELLRDNPDLPPDDRQRFVATALRGCAQLEKGVMQLAKTVYDAGHMALEGDERVSAAPAGGVFDARIAFDDAQDTVEIDLSDFAFTNAQIVNDFYDFIDARVDDTERDWYFVVNHGNCSVWPEAWVAFAYRGKRLGVARSLGTVRYDAEANDGAGQSGATHGRWAHVDPEMLASREAALARVAELRRVAAASSKPGRG